MWGLGVTLYITLVGKFPFQVQAYSIQLKEAWDRRPRLYLLSRGRPGAECGLARCTPAVATLIGRGAQDPRRPQDDQTTIRNTLAGRMNPIPDRVSPTARHLILSLLQTDPAKRPLLEQISVHPFVTQRVRHQHVFAFEVRPPNGQSQGRRSLPAPFSRSMPGCHGQGEVPTSFKRRAL